MCTFNHNADCPQDVAIMSSSDVISPGTELTCVAKAHPPANFRWLAVTGSGFVSGSDSRTLTVTSLGVDGGETGDVHFVCTAVNFLGGDGDKPCFASVELLQTDEPDHSTTSPAAVDEHPDVIGQVTGMQSKLK